MRGLGKGMKGGAGVGRPRGFHDPLLLHRVSECVADASHRKRPLDPDEVADSLRRTHREYQRKQRGPFLRGVAQAIQIVLERAARQGKTAVHGAGQSDKEEVVGGGTASDKSTGAGEEGRGEGDGLSERGEDGAGDEYKCAQEEQGEDQEGDSQEEGAEGGGEEGVVPEGLSLEDRAEAPPRPGAPSAESASLATSDSSRYTSAISTAQAKDELPGNALPADQDRRKNDADVRREGEVALQRAKAKQAPGPARSTVAGVGMPTSGHSAVPGAGPEGAPPAHLPSEAFSSKNKRQGGSSHPAAGPQTKRRRQASPAGPPAPSPSQGSSFRCVPRRVALSSLGGIEGVLSAVQELILQPLAHPELYAWLGVEPPRGVLLHGPPGCGKTMLAHAIAHEAQVPFFKISAPEIVSGMSGESEAKIRDLFREAEAAAPSIVFIDEVDAITPKRETAQREMERRIVAQLLTCIEDLGHDGEEEGEGEGQGQETAGEGSRESPIQLRAQPSYRHVVVLGATNRPDALDPALRRAGRFDREIAVGIPDEAARARILEVLSRGLRLQGGFDFARIARRTAGFVGADLAAVAKEAAALAVKRILSGGGALGAIATSPGLGCTTDPVHAAHNPTDSLEQAVEGVSPGREVCPGGGDAGREPSISTGQPASMGLEQAVREKGMNGEVSRVEEGSSARAKAGQLQGGSGGRKPGGWSPGDLQALSIRMEDFEGAVALVQPSAKREGFSTIPGVTWADVGALGPVREELRLSISRPILCPEEFRALGLTRATGVLLFGPPGCGKTLVAKAIANDAGANFISIKGPELLNKFVGESERAVRQLFARARSSSPCILFFDEMDAMAPRRGSDSNGAAERVVNQLLTEMDGLEGRGSVFLVAATNRPDMLDPALLRPGRLDKLLYVPLPDQPGRVSILRTLLKKVPSVGEDVDAAELGADPQCARFSGADLAALVREACVAALRERLGPPLGDGTPEEGADGEGPAMRGELGDRVQGPPELCAGMATDVVNSTQDGPPCGDSRPALPGSGGAEETGSKKSSGTAGGPVICVQRRHFETALQRIRPSVSPEDLEHYEQVKDAIHGARGHVGTL